MVFFNKVNKLYRNKIEFFNTEVKCINNKNDTVCNKMHYLKYMKDSASNWYVLSVSDLVKIFNHHKE